MDLKAHFSQYGEIVHSKVVFDKKGKSRRFGFVTIEGLDEIETGIVFDDQHEILGHAVQIQFARKNDPPSKTEASDVDGNADEDVLRKALSQQVQDTMK